jgi:hypothetical protein
MKITAAKVEEIEVEVSLEQVEILMCDLLKSDYEEYKGAFDNEASEIIEDIKIVYEAYSGKPIDFEGRFDN